MSALAIVRSDESVTIASDGAGYETGTGRLMTVVSKVALMPECSCIFANRGMGGATAEIHARLRHLAACGEPIKEFDDVLDRFPTLAEQLHLEVLANPEASTAHFSFLIGGYSGRRQRMESYTVRTRPFMAMGNSGALSEQPPFTLIGLPMVHLAPSPQLSSAAQVGITRPQEFGPETELEPESYALRAVAACRLDRETDGAEGTPGIHFVGGMLQVTTLYRDAAVSRIVHRWPDPLGEPIDPKRGDLLPAWIEENP